MAKLRYEVRAKTGTYKDKEGNEKAAYQKIGVVLQNDKGFMLKLETLPVNWDGWAFLGEPQERTTGQQTQQRKPDPADDLDTPF